MTARYIIGDVLDVLRAMPAGSVDLVLSSPPFLALRSYLPADHPDKAKEIGSEPTPGAFIDTLLDVVEECRRVLAPHGSLCFELGDTYAGSGGAGGDYVNAGMRDGQPKFDGAASRGRAIDRADYGGAAQRWDFAKPGTKSRLSAGDGWPLDKSLCLIPELLRVAMVYGFNPLTGRTTPRWRARNVVRWCRPNPPVGALGDKVRPATSDIIVACVDRKRYFDLDAVRTPTERSDLGGLRKGTPHGTDERRTIAGERANMTGSNGNGAPPLDHWWVDEETFDQDAWHIPTEPSSGAGTFRRVRVPLGVGGDGIRRTTSPGCPVHGSEGRPDSNGADDGHGEDASSRTGRSGSHPAFEQQLGFAPTEPTTEPLASSPASTRVPAPAATPHDTGSSRTDPAPATSPAGTPSAGSPARTVGTSGSPSSSEPHFGTPSSSTAEACPPAASLEMGPSTDDTSSPVSACSCSYYVEVEVTQDSSNYAGWPDDVFENDAWLIPTEPYRGSHYATWPTDLLVKPILAMCPIKVCTTCGKPSERITAEPRYVGEKGQEVDPSRKGTWAWGGVDVGKTAKGSHEAGHYSVVRDTTGWTDCGHETWRKGVVLDPFGGSGTTAVVALGHGRDAILIDLDERNADLARQRVGMWLEVEHHVTEVPVPSHACDTL